MKKNINKYSILIVLSIVILITHCDSKKNPVDTNTVDNSNFFATDSFDFRIFVTNHSQLELEGINGNVTINVISETDSVIITGEKRVGSESTQDAQEHLPDLVVQVQDLTNKIFIKTIQPQETYGRNYIVDYVSGSDLFLRSRGAVEGKQWAKVTDPLEYGVGGTSSYGVKLSTEDGIVSGSEITINKVIGAEQYGTGYDDMRNYLPWYPIDAIILITKRDGDWHLDMPMVYCGEEEDASLRWNENEKRAMAVFK